MTTLECDSVVFTKHPEGKRGACIPKDDYHRLCSSILGVLEQEDRITLPELIDMVQHDFDAGINANIAWRILVVKLDLEAKGIIKSVPHKYNRYIVYLKLNRREWKRLKAA